MPDDYYILDVYCPRTREWTPYRFSTLEHATAAYEAMKAADNVTSMTLSRNENDCLKTFNRNTWGTK